MPSELFQQLIQWLPWGLLVLGVICLPLSTVFYAQYLRFMKRLWSKPGVCGRLGGAIFGADWIRQVQSELNRIEPTAGRKWTSGVLSLAMIAAGSLWLWLRT